MNNRLTKQLQVTAQSVSFNSNKNKSVTATLTKVSSLPELTAKSRSNANHPEKLVEPPLQTEDCEKKWYSVDCEESSPSLFFNPSTTSYPMLTLYHFSCVASAHTVTVISVAIIKYRVNQFNVIH